MLAKLGWKIATGEETHWAKILQAKYLKGKSFFDCKKVRRASHIWQSILSYRNFLFNGSCFKVGNGLNVNPWKDPWLVNFPSKVLVIKDGMDTKRWSRVIDLRKNDGSG